MFVANAFRKKICLMFFAGDKKIGLAVPWGGAAREEMRFAREIFNHLDRRSLGSPPNNSLAFRTRVLCTCSFPSTNYT